MMKDMGFNYREAEESRKKFVRYKDGCKVYGLRVKVRGIRLEGSRPLLSN